MKKMRSLLLAIFMLLLSIWLMVLYSLMQYSLIFYLSLIPVIVAILYFIDSFLGKD